MKFICSCGHRISDTTDYLPYKGHIIADQDWFDFLEEIDAAIEKSGPTPKDKENALMKIRDLSINLSKTVYQCEECGNVFFDTKQPYFEEFRSCNDNVNKGLLQSAKGEKWQGILYGEWVDVKPTWSSSNGYIDGTGLIKGTQYDNFETLEKEYYLKFDELKKKNVLRYSTLKKNKTIIHSWSLDE